MGTNKRNRGLVQTPAHQNSPQKHYPLGFQANDNSYYNIAFSNKFQFGVRAIETTQNEEDKPESILRIQKNSENAPYYDEHIFPFYLILLFSAVLSKLYIDFTLVPY